VVSDPETFLRRDTTELEKPVPPLPAPEPGATTTVVAH
jgi:hypothetical protein